jgi:lipopolysaccharide transport system permease protein
LTRSTFVGREANSVISYFAQVWRLRFFWSSLVRTDLRNRYRRSVLGIGWSLMHPILMTAVFCVIFCPLFQVDFRQYAPYVLTGVAFWNFVVATASQGCHCFFQGEPYIRQQPAPLAIYPLRTVLGTAIHALASLAVALAFTWCVNGFGNLPALVGLLPAMVLMLLFGWALEVCCGLTNVIFQDTQHLIEVFFQMLFYLTPVMYPAQLLAERRVGRLLSWNPLSAFLDLLRAPILEGRLAPWTDYAIALGVVSVLLAASGIALARLERRLVFYL